MKKENLFPATLLILGVVVGVILSPAMLGGWENFDPAVTTITLAASAGAWWRARALDRRLAVVMEHKAFQITLGLREGYEEMGVVHTLAEAEAAYREWMEGRVREARPVVTGLLHASTVTFPVRYAGADGRRVTQEPGAVVHGALSPHYDRGRLDTEVVETLNDLGIYMGLTLGQIRVYISYAGRQWTVEMPPR